MGFVSGSCRGECEVGVGGEEDTQGGSMACFSSKDSSGCCISHGIGAVVEVMVVVVVVVEVMLAVLAVVSFWVLCYYVYRDNKD